MSADVSAARGSLHRGLTAGGAVRFLAVEVRGLAEKVRQTHGLGPDAAKLAAEALVANALMSAWIKGDERIALQIQGERPRVAFMSDVDAEGGLRARLTPPDLHLPPNRRIEGLMLAIKSDANRELYRGLTRLEGERIEEALAGHLGGSEQVNVLVRIEATAHESGAIRNAGGIVLERLPEHPEQPSVTSEDFASAFEPVMKQPVADLLTALAFGRIGADPIQLLENRVLGWRCSCSQERIESMLYNLGPRELQAMLDEDGKAEVTCHFCNIAYQVGPERLAALISR